MSEELDQVIIDIKDFSKHLDNPQPLNATMGQRVAVLHRKHFVAKNRRGNSRGWPSSNFWLRFQDVTMTADNAGATVSIPDPQGALRHKRDGGTIKPKRSKFLAIPLAPEAKVAGQNSSYRDAFPDAFVLQGKRNLFLARPGAGQGGRGSVRILAILLKSVTHKADPTALPNRTDVENEALIGATNYLERITRRLAA